MSLLTVLTKRVDRPCTRILKALPRFAMNRLLWRNAHAGKRYGGHHAVTRSLVEGLQKLGVDFNYNPTNLDAVGDIVVMLANVEALRQAIGWKRDGRIRRLLAGPNLMVFSNEHEGILGSPEIDVCLVPSDWVGIAYEEDMPELRGRIRTWWAGVDERYWTGPAKAEKSGRSVVVYRKECPQSLCEEVEGILRRFGWSAERISYGHYQIEHYKQKLAKARFAVFLSRSESQGIALTEALAMDVPTLVWNPCVLTIQGRNYTQPSACPYLTPQTGCEWATMTELEGLLVKVDEILSDCEPRAWVIKHMTDIHAAQAMIEIAACNH